MKKVIQDLEDWIKQQTAYYTEIRNIHFQRELKYEKALKSRLVSENQKKRILLLQMVWINKLEYLSTELITLQHLNTLAIHIAIADAKIDNISKLLKESGTLQKIKDIGDVAKLKNALKKAIQLLEKYYKEKKQMQQKAKEFMSYVE